MFHNIKYVALEIFHKIHKGKKNVDFLDFLKMRPFKWFLTWLPQKSFWKNLIFSNESCMVNFKPILNTLEMDFQKGL